MLDSYSMNPWRAGQDRVRGYSHIFHLQDFFFIGHDRVRGIENKQADRTSAAAGQFWTPQAAQILDPVLSRGRTTYLLRLSWRLWASAGTVNGLNLQKKKTWTIHLSWGQRSWRLWASEGTGVHELAKNDFFLFWKNELAHAHLFFIQCCNWSKSYSCIRINFLYMIL